jgi:probable F420-dependent oxidoreductase
MMDVGYFALGIGPLTAPEWAKPVAMTAERVGFASIWAPEHVVLLEKYSSKYPYSAGEFPLPTDTPFADPFTTLAFAAACTSNIRLATGICLVPEHNPLVLAKTVATLDRLSGGRLILGVGIGWLAEEFQALGISFERRAQRTREYIDVMRKLWIEPKSTHHGEFVSFPEVQSFPKPHRGSVPIWFGGETPPALRRVGEYGDGWVGFNLSPDEAAVKIKRLEEILKARGRKRSDVHLAVSPYVKPMSADDLKRYRDAGADEVVVLSLGMPSSVQEMTRRIEQMAQEFVEPAAKL